MQYSVHFVLCWFLSASVCLAAETSSLTGNLIAACKRNDLPAVQKCISAGVDVNAADEAGLPPLFYAVAAKNPSIVRLLIDHNAKVDAPHSGQCLMVRAIQAGHLEIFKMLADGGGDLHRRYQIGQRENSTLLHVAIMEEDIEFIRYLLSRKVSTETRNSDAESALLLAAGGDNLEIVKLLVENGAYLYADRGYGGTLLDSEMYRPSPQIKRYLEEIDRKRQSDIVEPAWAQFIQRSDPFNRIETRPIEEFLSQGGSILGTDMQGRTLLHWLAGANLTRMELFERVVSHSGADINAPDMDGNTPLHAACKDNKIDQVRILLDHDADVHARNREESTPLLILTRWHFNHDGETELKIATLLLDKGADVNAVNAFGFTALLYLGESNMNRKLEVTRLLVERGANLDQQDYQGNTFLHNAADRGTAAMMKIVIEAGADLLIRNYYGTSIQDSARYDSQEKLDLLYQYKKDVTLHEAVYYSQAAIVDQLLQTGTDINVQNRVGSTPLIIASKRNDSEMVKQLLALGADINAQDHSGCTALHYAAEQGYDEVVHDLLSNKADVNLRSQQGFRAVDLALAENKYRTLQLFKDAYPDVDPSGIPVVKETQQQSPGGTASSTINEELANTRMLQQLEIVKASDPNLFKALPLALKQPADAELFKEQMLKEQKRWQADAYLSKTTEPLHVAVIKGETETVVKLLADGADIHKADEADMLPFTYAVLLDNQQMAGLLLENGADINRLDSNIDFWNVVGVWGWGHTVGQEAGWGALHYAAAAGSEQMLDFLIQKGADLNLADKEHGCSPIFMALQAEKPHLLSKLIRAGASLNHTNKNSETIVHSMARQGEIESLKLLLKLGAPVDIRINGGGTPLMTAARSGQPDTMLFLIDNGADIQALNASGGNLLCSSIAAPYTNETLRILLEYGLDVNLKNSKGQPALFCLFNYGNNMKKLRKNVQLFLDAGVDVNASDNQGNTILHVVADNCFMDPEGSVELAELMIAHGADINRLNSKGETPLDSMLNGQSRGTKGLTALLAENNTMLNRFDSRGRNTLHNAAIHGWADVVAALASKGADLENYQTTQEGGTPLHSAVSGGYADVVKVLLEAGADVRAVDQKQETPLFRAVRRESTEITRLLLEHGADVNAQNALQDTVLHTAITQQKVESIRLLLQAGARTDLPNSRGQFPTEMARRTARPEIIALFAPAGT